MNRRSWVQIGVRLLLKVTEISFWKSYFYQKIIFHLLFVHSYLSYVTLFFHHQTISSWLKKLYPDVMSHLLNRILNIILNFLLLSPLRKGRGPSFEQIWLPSTKGCFVPSLVEIGLVVLEKKLKMWKVYRGTDRQKTDNRRSEKLTWAFSSGELHIVAIHQCLHMSEKFSNGK